MCRARQEASSPDAASRSRAELPQRVQHPVPLALAEHDGLVDEPDERVDHVGPLKRHLRAHFLGGGQAERPGEDGKPRPQPPLGGRAQLVRPLDRRAQRLVPGQRARLAAGQHGEPVVEPVDAARQRQRAQLDRGQLDRQRDAVEPLAQPDDVGARSARVIAKPATAAAARSANSSTASPRRPGWRRQRSQSPRAPAAARSGRCARPACRAAAVRWRARSRPARPAARPGLSAAQASSRCSQVSRISSSRRSRRYSSTASQRRPRVLLGQAEHAGDRVGQQRGVAQVRTARRSTGRPGSWPPPARPRRARPASCRPRPARRSSRAGIPRASRRSA